MGAHVSDPLFQSRIEDLELIHRGKVRDVYSLGPHDLLIVTCDRLSAFDVVLPTPIPGKGILLNRISNFWFRKTQNIIANHLLDLSLDTVLGKHPDLERLKPRAAVVRRLKPLPVEAIVRGYLAGSGWTDYQVSGKICGQRLPPRMEQAARLPEPLFTPSTKAEAGAHDENITLDQFADQVGGSLADKVRRTSIEIYRWASEYARFRGIIIADTKFEFGLDDAGELVLMDELLTPDSSRFWPADRYRTGINPPSFDKQFVRDYLETLGWDKKPPGPGLPDEVVARTGQKYADAYGRLVDGEVAVPR